MLFYEIGDELIVWDEQEYRLNTNGYAANFQIQEQNVSEEKKKDAICIKNVFCSLEELEKNEILVENEVCRLYNNTEGRTLVYYWGYLRSAIGLILKNVELKSQVQMLINPEMCQYNPMNIDKMLGMAGLHSMLMKRGGYVLHASYIQYQGKAILFTAPSQTGKSTQATLWEKYAGATIINGDRALLKIRDNMWHAYGYPCCGSSDICINQTLPLAAIVVLEQAEENKIYNMSAVEKIKSLVTATEVYVWDAKEIQQAISFAQQIIESIPVYKLACRPDKVAVDTLKEYLLGEFKNE